jgi:hypothetical protein
MPKADLYPEAMTPEQQAKLFAEFPQAYATTAVLRLMTVST